MYRSGGASPRRGPDLVESRPHMTTTAMIAAVAPNAVHTIAVPLIA